MSFSLARESIKNFDKERGWGESHNPKNLSMAISVEAAELMEIFQWMDTSDSNNIMASEDAEHVKEEIADIMIYCLSLCNKLELDPALIINEKIMKNALKHPVSK